MSLIFWTKAAGTVLIAFAVLAPMFSQSSGIEGRTWRTWRVRRMGVWCFGAFLVVRSPSGKEVRRLRLVPSLLGARQLCAVLWVSIRRCEWHGWEWRWVVQTYSDTLVPIGIEFLANALYDLFIILLIRVKQGCWGVVHCLTVRVVVIAVNVYSWERERMCEQLTHCATALYN